MKTIANSDVCLGISVQQVVEFFFPHLSTHTCSFLHVFIRTHLPIHKKGNHFFLVHTAFEVTYGILITFLHSINHRARCWQGFFSKSIQLWDCRRAFPAAATLMWMRVRQWIARPQHGSAASHYIWNPAVLNRWRLTCLKQQNPLKLLTLRARCHLLPTIELPHIHTCGGWLPTHQIVIFLGYKGFLLMDAEIFINILCCNQPDRLILFHNMLHSGQELASMLPY